MRSPCHRDLRSFALFTDLHEVGKDQMQQGGELFVSVVVFCLFNLCLFNLLICLIVGEVL